MSDRRRSDRDVAAFDRRASGYESGVLGELHRRIVESVAELALTATPTPRRVLDVGCGTGAMLRVLAGRLPTAEAFVGVDPAPAMLRAAAAGPELDPRVSFVAGVAEHLPLADDGVDLVVSTTSFDHWGDQGRGLAECARVLRGGAPLVLCDLVSPLLAPTVWLARHRRARTRPRVDALLTAAGFSSSTWFGTSVPFATVVAR